MANVIPSFGAITPSQQQQALSTNYLQFNNPAGANFSSFAQQYLPEIYEQEVERYGNRTLSGFLRMVGAEMPMTSDQVIWSEQNRLHVAYTNVTKNVNDVSLNIPLNAVAGPLFVDNVISVQDTIVIMNPTTGQEVKALVTASVGSNAAGSANGVITVATYTGANLATALGSAGVALAGLKIFVYGSEYRKGTNDNTITSITPSFTQFSNSPIIIKDRFEINGSDMAQIGWIEVATEDGTSGYLWYLKAESETRLRFEDYLEMAMVEGELAAAGSGVIGLAPAFGGTEGLFAAVQNRGNVLNNFTATAGLGEFDSILKNLDTQGAIEENMLFLNRKTSLDFDDMLSQISSGAQGGTAFGLFENSEEMALNLGFSGFRRGSYDFYKTDWKYLNDASTRGGMQVSGIDGVLIPAGTSTVYDQILGSNIRRPFLHVRYRASETEDRRMKSWITGSAGGAYTTGLDSMVVHFLSERCLCVQGANNFVLFTAS